MRISERPGAARPGANHDVPLTDPRRRVDTIQTMVSATELTTARAGERWRQLLTARPSKVKPNGLGSPSK